MLVLPVAKERLSKKVKKRVWDSAGMEIELKLRKGRNKSSVGEVSLLFQISVLSICSCFP